MTDSIYRQAALDRLASPERLAVPPRLVGRPSWLLLATFAIVIAAALVWAIVTEAPVKVGSSGILMAPTGFAEIVAEDEGRIDALMVSAGDSVRAGQPIATVARTELTRDLRQARAALADAQARYARLEEFYGSKASREARADAARIDTI